MSNDIIKKISTEIRKIESLQDKNVRIEKFQYLKKKNVLNVLLKGEEFLSDIEEEQIKKLISALVKINVEIEVVFYKDISDITLKEVSESYFIDSIKNIVQKTPIAKSILLASKREVKENVLFLKNGFKEVTEILKHKGIESELAKEIKNTFGISSRVELIYDETMYTEVSREDKIKQEQAAYRQAIKEGKNTSASKSSEKPKENKPKKAYEPKTTKKKLKMKIL